jgi:predicted DNA-binding transcriptional regulator YafY
VLDTSARLLKLLSLIQARGHWTGPELAARLGVGVRTVRRDVERLRTLEALDEHTCLLHTSADWLGGLAIYVAAIGVDFEVLDPPEFAAEICRLAERFTRAFERTNL